MKREHGPGGNDAAVLEELQRTLPGVMASDVRHCARRLDVARRRLARGQPVDRILSQVAERLGKSAERVESRRCRSPIADYDASLPITSRREEIIEAVGRHQVLIVAGETGSGKTTQLPRYCLEAGRGVRGLIGCTQPRRIAARAMAARVAEELGRELGPEVGYQVRFREQLGPDALLKFMTDGILLSEAVSDRWLEAYDTLIIDEAHERSLNIDFLLGYLKRLLPQRPDLRLIVTSATIDTEKFSRHFDDAPVIEVSGRGHPVDVLYRPLDEESPEERGGRDLYRAIGDAIASLDRIDPRGDVLVFLSGEREIHEARDYLRRAGLRNTEVLPLYARLSAPEQQRVFHPGSARRIVLATNVAETSLTVPRIRFVIDSGLARISRYAHRSRIQQLPIEPISRASANQRMGRCGRLGPGTCIRLYSEEDFLQRPEFTEPEILRTSLATVVLRMLTMGLGAVEDFPFIDPPAPRMINDAYQLLFELEAIDAGRGLTESGRRLAAWPIDVRLARMLEEGARRECLEDLLVLVAGLSIQDPRERPLEAQEAADEAHGRFSDERSDFVTLLKLWAHLRKQRRSHGGSRFRRLCRREFLAWQRVMEWFDLYQQLRDQAREQRLPLRGGHGDYEQLHRSLLSGLLSLVGQKDPEGHGYSGARNRSFHLFPGSGLFGKAPRWVVSAEIVETTRPYARMNAVVEPEWIEDQAGHLLKRRHFDPHWSRRRGRVLAYEQVSLHGLVLVERRRVPYAEVDPQDARRIFILEALVRGELDADAPFLRENRRLRAELEHIEHKRRQRDVLADEGDLAAFYDARLPADVHSASTLSAWLDGLGERELRQLRAGEDVLLREGAGAAPAEQYPDELEIAGRRFPLSYRFEPGHDADGVTLRAPLELLNTLEPGRLSWLVPGLLREKLVELMKSLPKPLRRSLTPLPRFADAALERLGAPRDLQLGAALAGALTEVAGVDVAPEDFDASGLDPHLHMRFEVVDDSGQVLAESRDLAALQERFGRRARQRFMHRQGRDLNRDGETSWAFETLRETVTTPDGVTAWPALVDQEDAVGLRLFESADEAVAAHAAGVYRLLALALADKFDWLRRNHGLSREAQLASAVFQDAPGIVSDLCWHALYGAAPDPAAIRDEAAFSAAVASTRQNIGPLFRRQSKLLDRILRQAHGLRRQLAELQPAQSEAVEDMNEQLEDLLYPGFLLDLEAGRLRDYPRYLEALELRLEALALDPLRDARQREQVTPYWRLYTERLGAGADYDAALDRYRWLLAEYRVSVFAQRLGTREKVSRKRLDAAWRDVERSP